MMVERHHVSCFITVCIVCHVSLTASGYKSFFFLLANFFTEIIWVIDCGDRVGKLLKNNPFGPATGKLR